jgi:uncharacterized membrane protein YkoI
MNSHIVFAFACLSSFALSAAAADVAPPKTKISVDQCEKTVLEKYPGKVVKVELKIENGEHVFEFDVQGKVKVWDIECNAVSGKITEEEQEVANGDDPLFKAKTKVSLDAAKEIALKQYPGVIIETEFEIESDGAASYEFDIKTKEGKEMKVEVDATTGKIVEANEEIWQRGSE